MPPIRRRSPFRHCFGGASPVPLLAPIVLLAAALALSSACAEPEGPPFREVVGTKLLMTSVLEPAADGVWDAVATVMTADGTEEIVPETEAEWIAVRNAAVIVGEVGNLLMTPRRAIDDGDWMLWSLDLVDAGNQAMIAAESRDADALFEAGGVIYEACLGCHEAYWAAGSVQYPDLTPESMRDESP